MSTESLVVDDEVKAIIGKRGPVRSATDEVSSSEMRRFAQAIFDDNRIYFDEQAALKSRFGARVGPGTFVISSLRPSIPFADDPLRRIGSDEDATGTEETRPRPRGWENRYYFHAGDEVELFRLPQVGDRISSQPYVKDIYAKTGRSGNVAYYVARNDFKDQHGQLIACHDVHSAYPEETGAQRREHAKRAQTGQPVVDPPVMPAPKPLDLARVDFEDIKVGDQLAPKLIRITVPIIIRWAMATESFRRDHYDYEFATRVQGHDNIIGSGLWVLSCRWAYVSHFAGRDGWVWKISHQLRARMNVGDALTASGTVTSVEQREKYGLVQLDVKFTNQNGVVAVPGGASVALPYRGGPAVPYPFVP
ncbi:MAG: MaoC family dehydratase N-terminal domain-containing protein [Pseudomonadota bacterium]